MNTAPRAGGSMELKEFMTSRGAHLNGVAASIRRAILAGALLWSGQAVAQFGPPGGFGGFDRGREYDRGRDSDRDRDRSSSSSSSSHSSSSHSSSSGQASPVMTPSRVRVTVGLPVTYADVDTNHDGQLVLSEWKKAKKTLAQFYQLDINKDGFLTPRELERAGSMPLAASPTPSTTPTHTGSSTTT